MPIDQVYLANLRNLVESGARPDLKSELQKYSQSDIDAASSATEGGTKLPNTSSVDTVGSDIGKELDVTRSGSKLDVSSPTFPVDYKTFLNEKGIASSSFDQTAYEAKLRADEEARLAQKRSQIFALYDPAIKEAEQAGKTAVSGETAAGTIFGGVGQSGLGFSSVREARISMEKERTEKNIRELMRQRDVALANADVESADRIKESIKSELHRQDTLRQQEFKNTLDLITTKNSLQTSELQRAKDYFSIIKDLPKGQRVNLGGTIYTGIGDTDPFYKSSDLISIMKTIPIGKEFEVEDPNTGRIWTLTGLAQEGENLKQFTATDDAGNLRIINYDPASGKIIGIAEAGNVGKSKTGINVNIGASGFTLGDILERGYKRLGSSDGGWDFYDPDGKKVSAEKVNQLTGVPIPELLKGTTNQSDLKKINAANPSNLNKSSIQISESMMKEALKE